MVRAPRSHSRVLLRHNPTRAASRLELSYPASRSSTLAANSDTKIPSQKAVKAHVATAVAEVVNSAPGTMDTLNELAAALGDDDNFAATVAASLATKAPLASPALTGNPTAPTQTAGDNSTRLATTAYVDAANGAAMQAETIAFYKRVIAAGGDIDAATLAALDELITCAKRDGWWSSVVEAYPFIGTNMAAALCKLVMGACDALLVAMTTNESLVDVSPSTVMRLNEPSAKAKESSFINTGATQASVAT